MERKGKENRYDMMKVERQKIAKENFRRLTRTQSHTLFDSIGKGQKTIYCHKNKK